MINSLKDRLTLKFTAALALVFVLGVTALAVAAGTVKKSALRASQDDGRLAGASDGPSAGGKYARREALRPRLRESLRLLGDRLEKSGKERVTLEGRLTRSGETAIPFRITRELPDRLRVEIRADKERHVITFDGKRPGKRGGDLTDLDEDLIETLVFDAVENLFTGPGRGAALRQIALRARADDSEAEDYAGPYYDVYEVTTELKIGQKERLQAKVFSVNSDTLLPEIIRYERERQGANIRVEVQFSDWREVHEQRLPFRVVRLENGSPTLTLEFGSISLGSEQQDGAFDPASE